MTRHTDTDDPTHSPREQSPNSSTGRAQARGASPSGVAASRRRLLRRSGVVLALAIPGCSAMPGDEATPEPDEGRDSYGIRLDSQSPDTYTVDLTVEQPWEEEVVFEETLTVEGATTRTWSGVITDPVEHSVRAAIESEAGETDTASTFVTPGQENSPPDTWVQVRIRQVDTHSGTVPGVSVFLESRS